MKKRNPAQMGLESIEAAAFLNSHKQAEMAEAWQRRTCSKCRGHVKYEPRTGNVVCERCYLPMNECECDCA